MAGLRVNVYTTEETNRMAELLVELGVCKSKSDAFNKGVGVLSFLALEQLKGGEILIKNSDGIVKTVLFIK